MLKASDLVCLTVLCQSEQLDQKCDDFWRNDRCFVTLVASACRSPWVISAMSWVKPASPCPLGMDSRQPVPDAASCILQKHSLALRRIGFLIPPCAKLLIKLLQPAPWRSSACAFQYCVEAFLFHFSHYRNQVHFGQGCRSHCGARTKQRQL